MTAYAILGKKHVKIACFLMFLEATEKTAILSGKEVFPLRGGGHGVLALCMLYLLRKKSEAPDSYTSLYGALKIDKIDIFR